MKKLYIILYVVLCVILSSYVYALTITSFTDGTSTGYLTYYYNGSLFKNISIPYWANVTRAEIDLTGIAGSEPSFCLQETANETSACGGLATGSYAINGSYIYMNYTIPANTITPYLWQIKHGSSGGLPKLENVTLPSNCTQGDKLLLRFWSYNTVNLAVGQPYCSNGTDWTAIGSRSETAGHANCNNEVDDISYGIDGNYDTYILINLSNPRIICNDTDTTHAGLWEEAIYWNILGNADYYPENITIRTDGNITYQNYSDSYTFNGTVTNIDLNVSVLQACIDTYSSGNATCELNFSTQSAGVLYYSNLEIDYDEPVLDNCTLYNRTLINYKLYDENNLTYLDDPTAYIKVDVALYNNTGLFSEFSGLFETNNLTICLSSDLPPETYLYINAEYSADNYVVEHEYIQNSSLVFGTTYPQNISLYALPEADSTSFIITYQNNVFLPVENAIIEIMRYYIDRSEYIVVEDGLTDEQGQTIGHFIEEDYLYGFTVKRYGTILAQFLDISAVCQELPCQINLNEFESGISIGEFDFSIPNLAYDFYFNKSNRSITLTWATLDSTSAKIEVDTILYDNWGNNTICSYTATGSSGVHICDIPVDLGTVVMSELFMDGTAGVRRFFDLTLEGFEVFGYTGYIMGAILYITLPLMAIGSPVAMVFFAILGLIFAGMLALFSFGKIFAIGSIVIWFIIAGCIIAYKVARRE